MIPSWALTMVMQTESPIPIFRLESLSFPSSDWKLPSNILGSLWRIGNIPADGTYDVWSALLTQR